MNKMNTITIAALILIFLGGVGAILLTIGQSISSGKDKDDIINTTKDENTELKKLLKERDSNISKQNGEILELSKQLRQKSEQIIKLSNDISNPIPSKFELNFESKIVLTSKEKLEIDNFLAANQHIRNIPFNARTGSCDKIDRLKDVILGLRIRIEKEGKTLRLTYEKKINNLLGYSTNNPWSAFHLTYYGNELNFTAHGITIEDIESDNIPRTLNDFKDAVAHIQYTFFYPHNGQYMAIDSDFYILDINKITLDSAGKIFEIKNLKKKGSSYTGTFSF